MAHKINNSDISKILELMEEESTNINVNEIDPESSLVHEAENPKTDEQNTKSQSNLDHTRAMIAKRAYQLISPKEQPTKYPKN